MTGDFAPPGSHADVTVIIVTFNNAGDIRDLLSDLRAVDADIKLRVVVVDNDSTDGTPDVVRAEADVVLVESGGNLGYAGGINLGLRLTSPCRAVLILNPDLRVMPGCVERLLAVVTADRTIGAVVPLMLDPDGSVYPSLRKEPTPSRAFGDALFGRRFWLRRPQSLSEFDYRKSSYEHPHDIDWATGAALMVRADTAEELGDWTEVFFLYSDETEYFRRVRDKGYRVRFDPSAVVRHELGGSGTSEGLKALLAVNRIRYVEMFHGALYTAAFRSMVALSEGLRSYSSTHRRILAVVLSRGRWSELPRATEAISTKTTRP